MKRTIRNRPQYSDSEETPSKKSNPSESLSQTNDEIEFEAEEEVDSLIAAKNANIRRIKIVREPAFGYKPRIVPPWSNRLKNRYVESAEYYVPRMETDDTTIEEEYVTTTDMNSSEQSVILAEVKTEIQAANEIAENNKNDETKSKKRKSTKKQTTEITEEENQVEEPVTATEASAEDDPNALYTYAVVDGEVQDTIVVDDDQTEAPVRYDLYQQQIYAEDVTSTYLVGSELVKHQWESNEEIHNFFMANPHLNYAPDVRELALMAKNASPEVNYQLITGLSGIVSCLKKEVATLKSEMVGLREIISAKKDLGNTKRRFSTMNDVRHPWKIQSMPPLREVDLVNTARTIDFARGTKRQMSNKDAITRFVKTCLELLIPQEYARFYTVRDRSHRKNGLKDIGDHAKEQITGCVLDLMGLYDIEELDDEGRADRAFFSNLVSHAMRMALIDFRRSEPRRILNPSTIANNSSTPAPTNNGW